MKQSQPHLKEASDPTLIALLDLAQEQQLLAQTAVIPSWLSPIASLVGQHIFIVSVLCSFLIATIVFLGWFPLWLIVSVVLFRVE